MTRAICHVTLIGLSISNNNFDICMSMGFWLRLEGMRMALLGMRTSIQRNFYHTEQ